jgi:hypothetical protein
MGKLRSHFVIFKVHDIAKFKGDGDDIIRLIGDVKKSDLLPRTRVALPLGEKTIGSGIDIDDTVRLTFFCYDNEIDETPDYKSAIISGMRVEVWNTVNLGWDKTFEKFLKDGEDWGDDFV